MERSGFDGTELMKQIRSGFSLTLIFTKRNASTSIAPDNGTDFIVSIFPDTELHVSTKTNW